MTSRRASSLVRPATRSSLACCSRINAPISSWRPLSRPSCSATPRSLAVTSFSRRSSCSPRRSRARSASSARRAARSTSSRRPLRSFSSSSRRRRVSILPSTTAELRMVSASRRESASSDCDSARAVSRRAPAVRRRMRSVNPMTVPVTRTPSSSPTMNHRGVNPDMALSPNAARRGGRECRQTSPACPPPRRAGASRVSSSTSEVMRPAISVSPRRA